MLRVVMLSVAAVVAAWVAVEPAAALLLVPLAIVLVVVHVPMLVFDIREMRHVAANPPVPPARGQLAEQVHACLGRGRQPHRFAAPDPG